jgi:hypothetical protein
MYPNASIFKKLSRGIFGQQFDSQEAHPMPELPEMEVYKQHLTSTVVGKKIQEEGCTSDRMRTSPITQPKSSCHLLVRSCFSVATGLDRPHWSIRHYFPRSEIVIRMKFVLPQDSYLHAME